VSAAVVEVVRRADLERVEMLLPAVCDASVGLVRSGGGGKWHVPVEGVAKGWGERCQHAAKATGSPEQLVVLDVLEQVCSRCAPLLPLPDAVVALWRVCALVLEADRFACGMAQDPKARTWLGYANALDRSPREVDPKVRELLRPWLDDDDYGPQAWKALAGWSRAVELAEEQLAVFREAAPAAVASVSVGAAAGEVSKERDPHVQARALERAAGGDRQWGGVGLWDCVRLSWAHAREQGRSAAQARDLAWKATCERWGRRVVVDVSALPSPAVTPVGEHTSPAQWAQAEYQHLWNDYVNRWCARLEGELAGQRPGSGPDRLLMVADWPLTHRADLAFLSQFRQVGPRVPADFREIEYERREPCHAVVLAVPQYAVDHALAHEDRAHRGRSSVLTADDTLGPDADQAAQETASLTLLRGVYPYLAEDAARDGKRPRVSAQVRAARAEQRAARRDAPDLPQAGEGSPRLDSCHVGSPRCGTGTRCLVGLASRFAVARAERLHPVGIFPPRSRCARARVSTVRESRLSGTSVTIAATRRSPVRKPWPTTRSVLRRASTRALAGRSPVMSSSPMIRNCSPSHRAWTRPARPITQPSGGAAGTPRPCAREPRSKSTSQKTSDSGRPRRCPRARSLLSRAALPIRATPCWCHPITSMVPGSTDSDGPPAVVVQEQAQVVDTP